MAPSGRLRMKILQALQALPKDLPPPTLTHGQTLVVGPLAQLGQITSEVRFVDQVEKFAVLEDLRLAPPLG